MLQAVLTSIRLQPFYSALLSNVAGCSLPRYLLARTPAEKKDVLRFETLNNVGFFGVGLLVDQFLSRAVFPLKLTQAATQTAKVWGRLGHSLGGYGILAGIMASSAFFRNALTAKSEKSATFEALLKTNDPQQEALIKKGKIPTDALSRFFANPNHALWGGVGALGAGLLVSLAGVGWARWAIAKNKALPKFLATTVQQDRWLLGFSNEAAKTGPCLQKLAAWPAFLTWVVPSYLGTLLASRDKSERREQFVKFINFNLSFFIVPPIIGKAIKPAFGRLIKNQETLANSVFVLEQIVRVGMLMSATLFNNYQTHKKQQQRAANGSVQTATVTSPFLAYNQQAPVLPEPPLAAPSPTAFSSPNPTVTPVYGPSTPTILAKPGPDWRPAGAYPVYQLPANPAGPGPAPLQLRPRDFAGYGPEPKPTPAFN